MQLRENQIEPVAVGVEFFKLKKMAPSIIVAPTAFGKSIVIAHIAKGINEKVLVLQPTKELLEQNYNKFISFGGSASIYSASMNEKEIGDVTYATIGSIISIASRFRELGIRKVIIDECDRYSRDRSGQLIKFINALKATHVLGLTATPLKLQSGMGQTGPYSKLVMLTNPGKGGSFFKHIIHVSQIQDIIKLGYWTPLVYQSYDFNTGKLVYNSAGSDFTSQSMEAAYVDQNIEQKIIKKVGELYDRRGILIAVPSIDQATKLAGKLPMAAVVHGGTPTEERNRVVKEFKEGKIRIIVQVNVLTVGFDYPELDCLITARPTASISWWYQFVGRGTRISPGKKECIVVDFVGSVERFGKVEDLYYAEDSKGRWELYGNSDKTLTGIPMHEIGLHFKGGINLAQTIAENGDFEKVYMTFGKYRNKPVSSLPFHYRNWLLDNMTWDKWNMKIKNEIIRLNELQRKI